MEAQFDETFFLVLGQSSEDLSGIQQMILGVDLVDVESEQRQVQQETEPVPVDEEQDRDKTLNTSLWDDVLVQFVTQLNRVDVVTLQVTVHDSEEHLEEQIDTVDNNCKDEKTALVSKCLSIAHLT